MNARRNRFAAYVIAITTALLAGACAAPAPTTSAMQPALTAMAQPYADGLRKAQVSMVQIPANGARVRVNTYLGDAYLRYPAGLAPTSFVVYVDAAAVEVDSDAYTPAASAQYEAAMKAILPAAIKLANESNARILELRRLDRG